MVLIPVTTKEGDEREVLGGARDSLLFHRHLSENKANGLGSCVQWAEAWGTK